MKRTNIKIDGNHKDADKRQTQGLTINPIQKVLQTETQKTTIDRQMCQK